MVIPVRGDVPSRRVPLVTAAIVAANGLVFLYEVSLAVGGGPDGEAVSAFFEHWGLVPREFLRGAAQPGATGTWVWATPLTAMFIHGGVLHLAGNVLYLWVFGRSVEDLLGHARFALFYAACGLAAAAAVLASDPSGYLPTVGASGAISGVLGAYAVSYPTGRLRLLWPRVRLPAAIFLLLWIALQVLSGVEAWGREGESIAWWGHVGGFLAGVALARPMWVRKPTRSRLRI